MDYVLATYVPAPHEPDTAGVAAGHPAGAASVAVAKYNPRTGKYIGPNGEPTSESNLAAPAKSHGRNLLPK